MTSCRVYDELIRRTIKEAIVALEKRKIIQRKEPRQFLYENVYLNNENRDYFGTIHDYSLGGIYIKSKRAVKVGDEFSLLLARPEHEGVITIETAKVVRKEKLGFALRFIENEKETDEPE